MSKETVEKWNDAFERVYPGPTQRASSIRVDVGDEAFKATWGGKTLADVQRENEGTVNKLFKEPQEIGRVFEPSGEKLEEKKALTRDSVKSMVDAGGVFEKQDKLDEQPRFSETPNKGLDNVNIDWEAFYDESDTMDPKQPHLSRQPTKFEDIKIEYHDTKDTVAGVKGLDPKDIDDLKKEQTNKLEPEKKYEPTLHGPTTHSTFGDLK